MVIRFFASNPILFLKRVGSSKSEAGCNGHFILLWRIKLNYQFIGIIA